MVIWICGLSGAGKTVIGGEVSKLLRQGNRLNVFLDGDILRDVWSDNLGHSLKARDFNAKRICHLCKMLDEQHVNVVASVLYPFKSWMDWNRTNLSQFYEIFLDVPLSELEHRDPKNLYAGARSGKIKDVVGIDIPFELPDNPDLIVGNSEPFKNPADIALDIVSKLPNFKF